MKTHADFRMDYSQLALAIKEARRGRGITQKGLAGQINRSVPTISKIENNKQWPEIGTLLGLLWLLDINPFDFVYVGEEFKKTAWLWQDRVAANGMPIADHYEVDDSGNVTIGASVRD